MKLSLDSAFNRESSLSSGSSFIDASTDPVRCALIDMRGNGATTVSDFHALKITEFKSLERGKNTDQK